MSEDNERKSCNSDTELNSKIMSFENVDKINKIISLQIQNKEIV